MRVVLDTNILVSGLLVQTGHPAAVYRAWEDGEFTLLTCAEQLDELRTTLRKPEDQSSSQQEFCPSVN